MEMFFDFAYAALPWVAMGLLLAVFFVIMDKRKESDEECEDYGSMGMVFGVGFGGLIGLFTTYSYPIGMMLGMLCGLVVGTAKKKKPKEEK